ncbi:low temperature requirement protein A [Amycolatopsis sp. 195334CR]|uniref:low temperature requirement protein A n=1 Tax=Amycolatopsis sp. 195334CR TaxID=2814588 RepID=UPI001A9097A6|nr:low temperature requirement protein A [Amycolatopsis sp. 195334CR]MBN6041826.1 low temperature requirement protein A [Amycolatopsis sp. 195334CR]
MRARDTEEPHRVATPLELLFDLCFVVAVAQAAVGLHHGIAENHIGEGVLSFLMVFFAIWWAWMNFTWFASSFDTDDGPYRLTTLVQIAGSLVVAAGVPRAFEGEFDVVVGGYVVMRLAMVTQWLRAARSDVDCRPTSLRYAAGIVVAQLGWVLWLFLPEGVQLPGFVVLMLVEVATPVWAERAHGTHYHRHHIAERYGLFTIIVLGETILSSTNAFREAIAEGHAGPLISLAVAALVIVFALWWLYFDQPGHLRMTTLRASLTWGYGHYVIFASLAALGAGIEVAVDYDTHTAHIGGVPTALATTIPVALFLFSVWLLHVGPSNECRPIAIGFPVAGVLVLASTFSPAPIHFTAGVCALLVLTVVLATRGHAVDRP